ncbi:Lrp/AsnC family transcriptional regulator [Ruegeria marina]|uniref:DNA-binding transcriptional regulator, Lrp family n=1 Tax=Ruegeria marina TaxID=639004 RepID=A0A1G6THF7_9RHOB|nr:Lrp/AsnC family transcriptional regulator [Ruegeria marina]SDD27765.1 DNA-binding transcriptional regulator, Lrp family [Ruegeria marina]
MTLDATDRRILTELQKHGRLTNVDLAARINLSPSPCLARVKALEKSGTIDRYVALVKPEALGLGLSVFIQVTLERQTERGLADFESRMRAFDEVMECYLMTGDSDYLVRLVVKDIESLQRFIVRELTTIPGVANIKSSFALKQVKYKTALPVPP